MHVPLLWDSESAAGGGSGKVSIGGIWAFSVQIRVPAQDAHVPTHSHVTALFLLCEGQ